MCHIYIWLSSKGKNHTIAGSSVAVECEPRVAETHEGILGVHTHMLTPSVVRCTLVHWTNVCWERRDETPLIQQSICMYICVLDRWAYNIQYLVLIWGYCSRCL